MGTVISFKDRVSKINAAQDIMVANRARKILSVFSTYPNFELFCTNIWDVLHQFGGPEDINNITDRRHMLDVTAVHTPNGAMIFSMCPRLDVLVGEKNPSVEFKATLENTTSLPICLQFKWLTEDDGIPIEFDEDGYFIEPEEEDKDIPDNIAQVMMSVFSSDYEPAKDNELIYFDTMEIGFDFVGNFILDGFIFDSFNKVVKDGETVLGSYMISLRRGIELINVVFNLKTIFDQEMWYRNYIEEKQIDEDESVSDI